MSMSELELMKHAAAELRDAPPWEKIRCAEQVAAAFIVWATALEGKIERLDKCLQDASARSSA